MQKRNSANQKKITGIEFFSILGTVFIVFIIYSFSLNREWQAFDERVFYNELIFPIPTRFDEIPEVIKNFVFGYHIESMNTFFSTHQTIRSNPIAGSLVVLASFFFKKNALLYHLFQLTIHLTNTFLVWLIFYKITKVFPETINRDFKCLLISFFTLLWALHSANTEAILLVTNWGALLTYTICLLFLLFQVSKISKNKFKTSKLGFMLITILFCLTMFITEYGYTMPFILFMIIFAFAYKQYGTFNKAFTISFKSSLPYLLGLLLFILISSFRPESPLLNLFTAKEYLTISKHVSPLYIFIERNLWLVPQIFLHFLLLIIFPLKLSTFQSNLMPIANTLFTPYSIFSTLFYLFFLALPVVFFITLKKLKYISPLVYAFYFALAPFLQIFLPTYCLSADRYCYFPSFILLFFIFILLSEFLSTRTKIPTKPLVIILSCFVILFGIRTLVRAQDWKNPYSLYKSAINIEKNSLYKGQKYLIFASYVGFKGNLDEMDKFFQKSLIELHKALKGLKAMQKKHIKQPITLKIYGLDYESLILKAAYSISTVKNDNYKEPAKNTLAFYKPYIKNKLKIAAINEIALYADILSGAGFKEEAKNILECGLKRYPYSSAIIYSLADYYLDVGKDLNKAYEILQRAYKYYPNQSVTLYKLLHYYELTNDIPNQAKFAYLLGLRDHSPASYQKAVQIYLDLNQLPQAEIALRKLIRLSGGDPVTLLLTSRYLDLTGRRGKILELLNNAYSIVKEQGMGKDIKVTKSILVSLINVNSHLGDINSAKKYLKELEDIRNLNQEDIRLIRDLKNKLPN